ncbi:ArsR/SmtB family transcription factor [Marinobacter sp. OP 3.4]|uniref:ArsR/SmtB family transcription factor n=1 Tax=Marinobacter sp. OP 3.4 TaxID=3076501 RepID=UPI002E1A5EE8
MADTSHLSVAQMRENASEATAILRLLAHEDRLLLLCQLSQEELCVSDLETRLAIRQPTLSQQLGVLRREELVATRRQGKHIYYRIADESVLALLQTLYELYCQPQGEIS